MAGLNGRLVKLERMLPPVPVASRCRDCGLGHARRITADEAETLVRAALGERAGAGAVPATAAIEVFCLCACCSDGRAVAELTHAVAALGAS
jgi:hypothetical protein